MTLNSLSLKFLFSILKHCLKPVQLYGNLLYEWFFFSLRTQVANAKIAFSSHTGFYTLASWWEGDSMRGVVWFLRRAVMKFDI